MTRDISLTLNMTNKSNLLEFKFKPTLSIFRVPFSVIRILPSATNNKCEFKGDSLNLKKTFYANYKCEFKGDSLNLKQGSFIYFKKLEFKGKSLN